MVEFFSKRLYKALAGFENPHNFVRISSDLREDLTVWECFLVSFNGCSFWLSPFCDASASAISLFTISVRVLIVLLYNVS